MAIAKKTRDILLSTLRLHSEYASIHLRGSVYTSMI